MSESSRTELEIVNLEDVVRKKAVLMLSKDEKNKADLDKPIINWHLMLVTHAEAKYDRATDYKEPTSNVLFTATFANNTRESKTYTLRTERRTKSVCNLTFKRAHTFGKSLTLNITPPTSIIGASGGFKREICKENGLAETNDQELSWSVDSQIKVPPGLQTTADLIIKEDHYMGDFTIQCTFEGDVLVTFETKDHKEHVRTVSGSVKTFLDGEGFIKDKKENPVFEVKGVCQCKYGIKQDVILTESEPPPRLQTNSSQTDSEILPPQEQKTDSANEY